VSSGGYQIMDMTFEQILKLALVWLGIFAVVGGIVSQTTAGVSGRGFMEGMWKGIEWFMYAVLGIAVIFAVIWGIGMMSTAINVN